MKNYFDKAIELHDQIKLHPFRETFTNEPRLGIWKSQCREYITLVIELTYAVADYFWMVRNEKYGGDLTSEQVRRKTEWAHDLISLLCTIRYIWTDDRHSQEIIKGLNIQSAQLCYADILTQDVVFTRFFVAILVFDCYNSKWIIIFKRCTYGC